jgi:hypothetical protein
MRHASTRPPTASTIASQLERCATDRSTRNVCGWMKKTTTKSANPDNHVVYASHLNQ